MSFCKVGLLHIFAKYCMSKTLPLHFLPLSLPSQTKSKSEFHNNSSDLLPFTHSYSQSIHRKDVFYKRTPHRPKTISMSYWLNRFLLCIHKSYLIKQNKDISIIICKTATTNDVKRTEIELPTISLNFKRQLHIFNRLNANDFLAWLHLRGCSTIKHLKNLRCYY